MKSRIAGFDGLRAIAVILVFMEHKVIEGYPLGWLGVKLFFVLSGYLIVSILHRQRAAVEAGASPWGELAGFWRRRSLRIFPIYFLTLSGASVLIAAGRLADQGIGYYWVFAGNLYQYLQGLATGRFPWGPLGHLWSVAIENQFYLLAGFALLLSPRRLHASMLLATLALSLGSVLALLVTAPATSFGYVMPLPNFGFMAAGGLLPLWWEKKPRPDLLPVAVAACAGLFVVNRWQARAGLSPVSYECIATLLELATSVALIAHVASRQQGRLTRVLEWDPIRRLGVISYGFYVYHAFTPQLVTVTDWLGLSPPSAIRNHLWMAVQFALTVIVSELSWRIIEQPLLRLKSSRAATGAVAQASAA